MTTARLEILPFDIKKYETFIKNKHIHEVQILSYDENNIDNNKIANRCVVNKY